MSDRVQARSKLTADCPDTGHHHTWTSRRGLVTYEATDDGLVVITEEAVAELLRSAGFHPDGPHEGPHDELKPGIGGYLGDQQLRARVAELRREHGPLGLNLDEGSVSDG